MIHRLIGGLRAAALGQRVGEGAVRRVGEFEGEAGRGEAGVAVIAGEERAEGFRCGIEKPDYAQGSVGFGERKTYMPLR